MASQWWWDTVSSRRGCINDSNAIGTIDRSNSRYGLGQWFDTRCITQNVGKQYEIRGKFKVVDRINDDQIGCDPNDPDYNAEGCPSLTFLVRRYEDPVTKRHLRADEYRLLATSMRPYEIGEWGEIQSVFTIRDEQEASGLSVHWYVERFNSDKELVLDDWSIDLVDPLACDDIVMNGDFSSGTTHFWGNPSGHPRLGFIEGTGGPGDSAIFATGRDGEFYGGGGTNWDPRGDGKIGCLIACERYVGRAMYKLIDSNGNLHACDPNNSTFGLHKCPQLLLRSYSGDGTSTVEEIGEAASPTLLTDGGWSTIAKVFRAKDQQAQANRLQIWTEDEDTTLDIALDDVSIVHLPRDCSNLIHNSNFDSGIAEFWHDNGNAASRVGVVEPGYGGTVYALRSYDREHHYRGLSHKNIDETCLGAGDAYTIEAKFMLWNATAGRGARRSLRSCPGEQRRIFRYGEFA